MNFLYIYIYIKLTKMSLEEFDAFTSLKALRDLKKQIEAKA